MMTGDFLIVEGDDEQAYWGPMHDLVESDSVATASGGNGRGLLVNQSAEVQAYAVALAEAFMDEALTPSNAQLAAMIETAFLRGICFAELRQSDDGRALDVSFAEHVAWLALIGADAATATGAATAAGREAGDAEQL